MRTRHIIVVAILVALVYWAPRWMHQERIQTGTAPLVLLESLKEMRAAAAAASPRQAEAVRRKLREAEQHLGTLTPDQRALFEELQSARADPTKTKALDTLIHVVEERTVHAKPFYGWAAELWVSAHEAYARVQPQVQPWLWVLAILVAASAMMAALRSQTALARRWAQLGFSLSRGWLVILSLLAIALVVATRINPWPTFPREFLLAPIVTLIGSAFALRMVDLNYPVWNSVVRGCGAPLIAMAFTAVFLELV